MIIIENIAELIYEGVARSQAEKPSRGYLGMSMIGNACERSIWHAWRQTTQRIIDGRILLLFETGHHIEMIVCKALRQAGFVLRNAYPDEQLSYSDCGGYFGGHPDGIIEDSIQNMILEIKSCNSNKFKQFHKNGVQAVYWTYFVQMQLYMHYAGLRRALFVAMNKETSEIYTEIIENDSITAKMAIQRAKDTIITHEESGGLKLPDKNESECLYCSYKWACESPSGHFQTNVTCRSCSYFKMTDYFVPHCLRHNVKLKRIDKACKEWSWILLTPFAVEGE